MLSILAFGIGYTAVSIKKTILQTGTSDFIQQLKIHLTLGPWIPISIQIQLHLSAG